MNESEIKAKSQDAQRLMADSAFTDFVEEVRKDQLGLFANSAAADTETREGAHAMLRALNLLESKLKSKISDEKFFDKKLKG